MYPKELSVCFMPANPTARYGYVSKEQLREHRYKTRLKPNSNKYRYKILRNKSIVGINLINTMKSTPGYAESKLLEVQHKFAEQANNMVEKLLFKEVNNVQYSTLGIKETDYIR